jgi:hypothetical protein
LREDKEFGDVLFGDKKNEPELAKIQNKKPGSESNVPDESKLLAVFRRWVASPSFTIDALYKVRNKIKALSNDYPKMLKPSTPNGTLVYRGLKNVGPELEAQIKKSKPEDWVKAGGLFVLRTPIDYVPRSNIQSWTTEKSVAINVFGPSGIVMTKQNDEFMLNQDMLSVLYGDREHEVLHFGKAYKGKVYFAIIDRAPLTKKYKNIFSKVKDKEANIDSAVSSTVKERKKSKKDK